jgi:hypothetical protein
MWSERAAPNSADYRHVVSLVLCEPLGGDPIADNLGHSQLTGNKFVKRAKMCYTVANIIFEVGV